MTTQLVWSNPPSRKFITAVDAGVVVLVRINPTSGTGILTHDATGTPPHLVFSADFAPRGTTAMVMKTIFGDAAEVGMRPSTFTTDQLSINSQGSPEYLLDIGRAFFCPLAGNIALEGGAFAPDGDDVTHPAPYEVSVQAIMPGEISLEEPFMNVGFQNYDRRVVRRQTGEYIRRRPTMTYYSVGSVTAIPIPRGAVDVQIGTTTTIDFNLGGNSGGAATGTLALSVPSGYPMPLGYLSQGTFKGHDATIDWISFGIEVG